MQETRGETQETDLTITRLPDRDLLIRIFQRVEELYELVSEDHGAIMRIDGQLSVFAPLLAKYAPGGKLDMIGAMQARREARRGG